MGLICYPKSRACRSLPLRWPCAAGAGLAWEDIHEHTEWNQDDRQDETHGDVDENVDSWRVAPDEQHLNGGSSM
jgi:hypothetical protein